MRARNPHHEGIIARRGCTIITRVGGPIPLLPRDTLAALTAPLRDEASSIGDLAACIARLERFLDEHTPFRRASSIADGESHRPDGWAVSPTQAAMCARDYRRTHAFARGLHLAIEDARTRIADRPIRVLYAGCGPWALIALPVMAAAPPGSVRFTLVDLHQNSVDSVRALIASAGLAGSVEAFVQADAATWIIPGDTIPDVIVTETMNVCLEREPQVAITRNLLRQAPHARLVPRSVRIDALLVDLDRERPRVTADGEGPAPIPDRIELGTVFELNAKTVAAWEDVEGDSLPAAPIQMPDQIDPRYSPRLFTGVETFGGERLDAYESWLTPPRPFPENAAALPGSQLAFRYELGAVPRLMLASDAKWPDRLRLPFFFDPARLREALADLERIAWTDHFVTRNYEGHWSVIPLRAPAGTEHQHPILQIAANPGVTAYAETPALDAAPYLREVLHGLGFPLGVARLMRLDAGSVIKTHTDPDLAFEEGTVRLHIPVATNPGVEFLVNGIPVVMMPGECWYLRLSDPHSVRNDGGTPRVHLVIDAPVTPALEGVFARALQRRARHRS